EIARPAPASTPRRIRWTRGVRRSGGAEPHSCSAVPVAGAVRRLLRDVRFGAGAEETERHQRKVVSVHVVAQIEVARKSGAGEEHLVPRTIVLLSASEVLDPAHQLGAE